MGNNQINWTEKLFHTAMQGTYMCLKHHWACNFISLLCWYLSFFFINVSICHCKHLMCQPAAHLMIVIRFLAHVHIRKLHLAQIALKPFAGILWFFIQISHYVFKKKSYWKRQEHSWADLWDFSAIVNFFLSFM